MTSEDPFTVTYKIRPEAQWTDNAPIAADDYWYLWRQMVSQPGVVDPAGYDLITGVQSVEGGKTAVVTFSQPYPAWRELFNDILPAHIVKDVPGGFAAGLARALPVTGGQFRVESIDPQRDEILLARNDRYWGAPAKPDQVLFRRGGDAAALGRLDPQRRHPGRPGTRRRSGVRATVGDPRRAHRAHRHPAGHADDAAGAATRARGFPSAQSDFRSARRRPARRGRRGRRQHGDAGAGAGAIAVGSRLRADRAAGDLERGCARVAGRRGLRGRAGRDADTSDARHAGAGQRSRPHHQGRRAADAGARRGRQRSDVGRGGQHRRRPTAQRRHRRVGARRSIRWPSTATRWRTTGSTPSWAGIRPGATSRPRSRRATAAPRSRRRPVATRRSRRDPTRRHDLRPPRPRRRRRARVRRRRPRRRPPSPAQRRNPASWSRRRAT